MAVTLAEAAKNGSGDKLRDGIIEIFARSNDLLANTPLLEISGNSYSFVVEETLPAVGFRSVNEAYTEAAGVLDKQSVSLAICGGDLDVDRFIVRTEGERVRSNHVAMKAKSLAGEIGHRMIKGDSSATPEEFDGLQRFCIGDQVISNGATSGGDPLSLLNLHQAIDATDTPTHLLMSQALLRRLTAATRDTSIGGQINFTQDQFGRVVTNFNGLPILIADRNADKYASLAFDEAATGGASTATSIYVLSLAEGMVQLVHNGGLDVRDLGELDDSPVFRTRVEWFAALGFLHPRSATRLRDISDAAVAA